MTSSRTAAAVSAHSDETTARGGPSTLYRHVVADARQAGLKVAEIGDITGVSDRAVQNWANGTSRPEGDNRDRLLELKYVIEQLSDVYTEEGIDIWLHARQRALDGLRPIDLLKSGDFEIVLQLVDRLAGGPRR